MAEHANKAVPASYVILRKGDQVLLTKRVHKSYYNGMYQLPSGHVDAGEMPLHAAVREAKEEIGVDIDPNELRLALHMYRGKHDDTGDRVDDFFETTTWEGEPANMEPDKCSEVGWFSIRNLPENMIPHNKAALLAILNGVTYLELGEEFYQWNPAR